MALFASGTFFGAVVCLTIALATWWWLRKNKGFVDRRNVRVSFVLLILWASVGHVYFTFEVGNSNPWFSFLNLPFTLLSLFLFLMAVHSLHHSFDGWLERRLLIEKEKRMLRAKNER